MDSAILHQFNNKQLAGKDADSGVIKTKKGRKKTDTKTLKINEEDANDIIDKRDRPIACVLSGESKQYLGKE